MRELIHELGQDHTVIFSSHILAEVEQTCSEIIIIAGGQLVAQGSAAELRKRVTGPSRLIIEVKGDEPDDMAAAAKGIDGVVSVETARAGNWTRLSVQGPADADLRPQVASAMMGKGYELRELRREIGSLEDFFVQITYEQSMREAAGESGAAAS